MKPRTRKKCQTHKRNILYFNPPYSQGVRTNVGAKFLKLINKHFPKSNPLSKIINRNSVKISYRCSPNMGQIISSHNPKLLKDEESSEERKSNCRKNATSPLRINVWKIFLSTRQQWHQKITIPRLKLMWGSVQQHLKTDFIIIQHHSSTRKKQIQPS